MAKNSGNDAAGKPEQSTENTGEATLPLADQLVKSLCDAADMPFEGVTRIEGEHESDYLPRVLPVVAEAIKVRMREVAAEASQKTMKLIDELKATRRSLASQKGATTKVKARIVEMEEASRPRSLGAMQIMKGIDGPITAEDLLIYIDAAEEIVLAFSDGRVELSGIKPRQVRADAFQLKRGRLLFTDEPLEVTGPGGGDDVATLAGVALLVDGEQVGWAPMPQPIRIGAGQTINLAGSVIFG